jgi:hypothetical protein
MRSLTRLIFGMALAAAAPAANLLVMSYGQDAAAKPGVALNGVALNGNGLARMSDAAGVADPNRLCLRAIRLPGE